MSITYYLLIDGVSGGSVREGFRGAIEITDFSYSISKDISPSGASRANSVADVSDVTVELFGDQILSELSALMVAGTEISSVQIVGVQGEFTDFPLEVYELSLGDVQVSQIRQTDDTDSVSFSFQQFELETSLFGDSREVIQTLGYEYNLLTGEMSAGVGAAAPDTSTSVGGAGHYYLFLDGISGDVQLEGLEGAFELDGFDYSLIQEIFSGRDAGRLSASELSLSFDAGNGAAALAEAMALGQNLFGAKIIGATFRAAEAIVVSETELHAVTLTALTVEPGSTSLDLGFEAIASEVSQIDPRGNEIGTERFAWDFVFATDDVPSLELEIPSPVDGQGDLRYFLIFPNVAGSSNQRNFEGAIELNDFAFSLESQAFDLLSTRSSAALSEAFASFEFMEPLAAAGLAGLLLNGTTVPEVSVVGVDTVGKIHHRIGLGDVVVTGVTEEGLGDSLPSTVTVAFSKASVETRPDSTTTLNSGLIGTGVDLLTGTSISAISQPAATTPAATGFTEMAVFVDGFEGHTSDGGTTLDDFSLSFVRDLSLANLAVQGISRPSVEPVTLNFTDPRLSAMFFEALTDGTVIEGLTISGVKRTDTQANATETFNTTFANVRVASLSTVNEETSVSLSFERVTQEIKKIDPLLGGVLETGSVVAGFDLTTGQLLTKALTPVTSSQTEFETLPEASFHLLIEEMDGGGQINKLTGAFAVDFASMSFESDLQSGPSAGSLVLGLKIGASIDAIIETIGDGEILGVRLVAVGHNDNSIASTMNFANARLTSLSRSGEGDVLTVSFDGVEKSVRNTSTETTEEVLSYDFVSGLDATGIATGSVGLPSSHVDAAGAGMNYYLRVEGMDGGQRFLDFSDVFYVSDVDFSFLNAGASQRASGQVLAGLSLTLDESTAEAAQFFAAALSGEEIPRIQLMGDKTNSLPHVAFDLRLGNVVVQSVEDGGVSDTITFGFELMTLETTVIDSKGRDLIQSSSNYDFSLGEKGETVVAPVSNEEEETTPENVANDDTFALDEAELITGNVLDNDQFAAFGNLVEVNTDVQNGTLTLNTDGTFEYVPDRVEGPVSDSFIYQLNDADGGFVTATVSLSIANPVFENLPPIAEDDFFILLGQDSFQGNVLLNDKDPDGGTLSTKLVEQARFGSVVLNFDGSFSYALNGDAVGTSDSFVYQLFDADGASVKATVFIQIDNDVTEVVVEPDILLGSFLDDKLTAPNKDNPASIDGLEGDDTLTGSNQADTINAGDGSDRVIGLDGDDLIFAGSSEKDLRDVVFAGEGNDTVEGGHGNDELRGDGGDDSLSGGFGVDTVIGGNGNDTLTGSAFSDLLFGGADDDFINGGFGFDRVNGGAGADQFFHIGDKGHGSDWIQDYSASEGDVMVFGGGTATVDDFLVQRAETKAAGVEGVEEAFITHKPSGVLLWALVDGGAQTSLLVKSGGQTFDLLAPRVVIDVISKDILTSNTEETDLFF